MKGQLPVQESSAVLTWARFLTVFRSLMTACLLLEAGCEALWSLQLASHCACAIRPPLCDWSCSLLGAMTCSKRLQVGGGMNFWWHCFGDRIRSWECVPIKTRYPLPPLHPPQKILEGGGHKVEGEVPLKIDIKVVICLRLVVQVFTALFQPVN